MKHFSEEEKRNHIFLKRRKCCNSPHCSFCTYILKTKKKKQLKLNIEHFFSSFLKRRGTYKIDWAHVWMETFPLCFSLFVLLVVCCHCAKRAVAQLLITRGSFLSGALWNTRGGPRLPLIEVDAGHRWNQTKTLVLDHSPCDPPLARAGSF